MVQNMNSFMASGDGMDAAITPILQVGGPRALSIKTAETLGAKRQGERPTGRVGAAPFLEVKT